MAGAAAEAPALWTDALLRARALWPDEGEAIEFALGLGRDLGRAGPASLLGDAGLCPPVIPGREVARSGPD